MPFRSENPIVRVEPASMHTIDTSNVQDLFGLWSVFSKCAGTMKDGKRLENMSWRLWNRETFCCNPERTSTAQQKRQFARRTTAESLTLPELSSSVESDISATQLRAPPTSTRPELTRLSSTDSRRSRKKHMTPVDLQNMVISIKESQVIEPLPELPPALQPEPQTAILATQPRLEDTTPRPSSPPSTNLNDSSTSTVATAVDSELANMSPPVGSEASTSTDISSHSVVRGFSLGRVSSSLRSNTKLAAAPTPILKNSPRKFEPPRRSAEIPRKKGGMFQLGASSEEEASSVETRYMQNSTQFSALKRPATERKRASFKIGADLATTQSDDEEATDSEAITDDDDEDEEDPDESAIEDDDDEWMSEDESGPSSVNNDLFQRVDSRPQLSSRRSLLTTGLNQEERAAGMQAAASRPAVDSRSAPALRRSRTTSPNGPSLASSPKEGPTDPRGMEIPSRPIQTTTNGLPRALSPRTTRRNMLSTELTESLRKHLLWERQQKNATSNAALKRRHTSNDVKNLKCYPNEAQTTLEPITENAKGNNNSWNAYFDNGLQEYHVKGW